MSNTSWPRKLTIALPLIAILWVGLLFLEIQVAHAWLVTKCCGGKEVKWNKLQIKWDGDFQYGQSYLGVFPSETRFDLANAARQWDAVVTGASLNVDEALTPEHDIWWSGIPFSQRGLPPDNPGYTVSAVDTPTGFLLWQVSYLNSEWTWNRICNLNQAQRIADARVVGVHESGHWMSLEDNPPNHQEAVMWANYTCKLQTVDDDHNGAKHLYP